MKQLTNEEKEAEFDKAAKLYGVEFRKAAGRVTLQPRDGKRSEYFLRWAITFARRDSASFSYGQIRDLQYEINFFVFGFSRFATEGTDTPVFDTAESWPENALNDEESYSYRDELMLKRLPSRGTVCEIHRLTIKHFQAVLDDGRTELALPPNAKVFLSVPKTGKRLMADLSLWCDPQTVYLQKLFAAISQYPDRLRRCPGCNVLFFADRKNQDFHTAACRSRHYMRLRRDIPPERFGIRGRKKSLLDVVVPLIKQHPAKVAKKAPLPSSKKTGKTTKSPRRKDSHHGAKKR